MVMAYRSLKWWWWHTGPCINGDGIQVLVLMVMAYRSLKWWWWHTGACINGDGIQVLVLMVMAYRSLKWWWWHTGPCINGDGIQVLVLMVMAYRSLYWWWWHTGPCINGDGIQVFVLMVMAYRSLKWWWWLGSGILCHFYFYQDHKGAIKKDFWKKHHTVRGWNSVHSRIQAFRYTCPENRTILHIHTVLSVLTGHSGKVLGPVVQRMVSLTSWLVVKMLTVLVSTISNLQVILLNKCKKLLQMQKLLTFFSKNISIYRDHFLARFRDILAFFCKKSHQNSRSEKKNRTLNFSHFAPLSSYFAHAVHFETIGLFCLTGFWIIVAPKFITHTNAGNHSLICIIEKLYRKNSVGLWFKCLFDRYLESAKTCPPTRKKKERKLSDPKPSSRDGNMLKYLVRAQPSSTEAATLSSPDSDDDLRSNTRPSWAWWITSPWSPYSAVCILLRARHNE